MDLLLSFHSETCESAVSPQIHLLCCALTFGVKVQNRQQRLSTRDRAKYAAMHQFDISQLEQLGPVEASLRQLGPVEASLRQCREDSLRWLLPPPLALPRHWHWHHGHYHHGTGTTTTGTGTTGTTGTGTGTTTTGTTTTSTGTTLALPPLALALPPLALQLPLHATATTTTTTTTTTVILTVQN